MRRIVESTIKFYSLFALLLLFACSRADTSPSPSYVDCPECPELEHTDIMDNIVEADPQTPPPECEQPQDWQVPDSSVNKFAMNLLHFNIQYVAGGLLGFGSPEQDEPGGLFAYDEFQIENLIIEESFIPVLEFYDEHPQWHATIELQGYMIDILAKRYPDALALLRKLVNRRQIELISFHWSDELFLAYFKEQSERSIELTDASFRANCLTPGESVFTQEGQFAPAMAEIALAHGRRILLLPKNLFKYQHHSEYQNGVAPLYKMADYPDAVVVVVGASVSGEVETTWTFFNDGELLATNGLNPYFGKAFKYNPEAMEEYAQRLEALEEQGFKHVTITEYVKALEARGIQPEQLPPMHGGDWQPKDTRNLHRWMGGCDLTCATDRDNEVLITNFATARRLLALDVAYQHAFGNTVPPEAHRALMWAWRYHLLACVSDATGWNPFEGEINYALRYNTEAEKAIQVAQSWVLHTLGTTSVRVNILANTVETNPTAEQQPEFVLIDESEAPFEVEVLAEQGRNFEVRWYRSADAENHYALEVEFDAIQDGNEKEDHAVEVKFPRFEEKLIFVPTLNRTRVVEHSLSDYDFQKGETSLSLPTGLVGLGQNWFVIEDHTTLHIAAIVPADEQSVVFLDQTQPVNSGVVWRFEVLNTTPQKALEHALLLNLNSVELSVEE